MILGRKSIQYELEPRFIPHIEHKMGLNRPRLAEQW